MHGDLQILETFANSCMRLCKFLRILQIHAWGFANSWAFCKFMHGVLQIPETFANSCMATPKKPRNGEPPRIGPKIVCPYKELY
jgi:hypothetical protein